MKVEEVDIIKKIVNKQFEMIGETITFEDIPEDGIIVRGKRKEYWWNVYHFTEEQEEEWINWAYSLLRGKPEEKLMDYVNLRYGFQRDYGKKEGSN